MNFIWNLSVFAITMVGLSAQSYAMEDQFWGYCNAGKAFKDEAMTIPKPEADKVCQLPDAYAVGATQDAGIRCSSLQKEQCQIGAGGDPDTLGPQNVSRGAFFLQTNPNPAATGGVRQMRCMCGCFTADTVLTSTRGASTILSLYQSANEDPFRLVTPESMFAAEYKVSPWITRGNFTIGVESKPVLLFVTEEGERISVTEMHPMVLNIDGEYEMRLASELKVGDTLIAADGTDRHIKAIEAYTLPADNNLVYNIDTKGERMLDHLVQANGLLVGDLYLQNMLSERSQRVKSVLNP